MNLDRSRQDDIPRTNHTDPLPCRREPEGRRGEPQWSADGISWVCSLRRPLTLTLITVPAPRPPIRDAD